MARPPTRSPPPCRPPANNPWVTMIGAWDELRPAFNALEALALRGSSGGLTLSPFEGTRLAPPLPSPSVHIFAAGSNTAVHIQRAFKAMKNLDLTTQQAMQQKLGGLPPNGFTVFPDLVVGPNATVSPPAGTQKFDYEGECAVYVKRGGRNLKSVELWGYTALNDLGVRDPHLGLVPEAPWIPFSFNLPKNFDGAKACGPWVVVDEGHDINTLRCQLRVNGELRQDWNLADMIYSFDETLCHLSDYMTLRPGDMLSSGTGAGVAIEGGVDGPNWLKPGDVIDIELDGAGMLTTIVGQWQH
jgi:2-keto-4-pentenoate hydratase/2-oxohepta-3-ene-1,7-dioic acid hydratase in catechol pathway